MNLSPVQIAVLALAHGSYAACVNLPPPSGYTRHPDDVVAVWGTWQLAARQLHAMAPALLACMGTARGTREMEWQNLRGKHRRGKEGRLVHLFRLERRAVPLAARCAYAVTHMPNGYATWRNVPAELPGPRAGKCCQTCACEPETPCVVVLPDGCGEGVCVPAGVIGLKRCSACTAREAA